MGLFIRQDENRSELQERLAAELREKAKLNASRDELLDETKDSRYIKDLQSDNSRSWIWVLFILVVAGVFIAFAFYN